MPDAAASSMIEVEFAGGARMRIEGAADLATVSAIIKTLARDTPVHNIHCQEFAELAFSRRRFRQM